MITLQQVVEFLRENKYLLVLKGKYSLSATFQDAMKQLKKGEVIWIDTDALPKGEVIATPAEWFFDKTEQSQNVRVRRPLAPAITNWQESYIAFISEAKVPAFLENSKLERYAVNKYSEEGMKAFRKAIESGFSYALLVKSTMLYYKSAARFKKSIGNYMSNGDWLSDYRALEECAIQGESQLKDYIKTQITNDRERDPFD